MLEFVKQLILVFATFYGAEAFKNWLQTRKEKKNKASTDYSSDYSKKIKLKPILEEINYELAANRVQLWEFSNGEKTLSGHHLKKLSLFMESNSEGERDIASQFQLVPVKQFERLLDRLYESEHDYIVTNELQEYDELSNLYAQYNMVTILSIKLKNEIGVWIGILSICFTDTKVLNDGEIAFSKLQASRLSTIK